jgi:hypothetical protein
MPEMPENQENVEDENNPVETAEEKAAESNA